MALPFQWHQAAAITQVRNTIGDPDGAATERWTDAEIASYLDRGGQALCLDTGTVLETYWTFDIVADTQEYAQHQNFIEAKSVKWERASDDFRKLEFVTRDQWDLLVGRNPAKSGEPTHYTIWNQLATDSTTTTQPPIFYLWPVPTSVEVALNATVHVWGNKLPDVFVAPYTQYLELRGHHVEAQVQWASAMAFMDDDEVGKSQVCEGRYQRIVEKIKNDMARKDRSRRPRIRPRNSRLISLGREYSSPIPQRFPGA
jgi:hypothetical protein